MIEPLLADTVQFLPCNFMVNESNGHVVVQPRWVVAFLLKGAVRSLLWDR